MLKCGLSGMSFHQMFFYGREIKKMGAKNNMKTNFGAIVHKV